MTALLLLAARAHADERREPKAALADQLADEMQAIEKTLAIVSEKLSAADSQRLRRVRAAYRVLHAPLGTEASERDRMASARRRAAARLLLERDRGERELLADEATQLRAAQHDKRGATGRVPELRLPERIERPTNGSIARRFGTYVHERSKATLSRRGLDFEVDEREPARAPAEGTVRYAGPIRGLDHGVVLDHGDYLTIVAKLDTVSIPVGTKVAAGDRLGRAASHRVYLEVRAKVGPGGLPIDPEPLLRDDD